MKWDLIIDLTSYILRRITIFGIRGTWVGWVDPTIPISAFGLTIQNQVSGTVSLLWLYNNISDKYWSSKTSSYSLWKISYPEETIEKLLAMGKELVVMSNVRSTLNHYNYATPESEITVCYRYRSIYDVYSYYIDGKNGGGSSSGGPYDVKIPLRRVSDKLYYSYIVIKCDGFSPRVSNAANITYSLSVGSIYFT